MVQLSILNGRQAGNLMVVRRFPFSIGRGSGNQLQLDDDGVWERHATLEIQERHRFVVQTIAGALLSVNLEPQASAALRNGDILSIGSVKLQFSLAPTSQRGLVWIEAFLWLLLALVTAAQMGLIYWLVRATSS